MARWGHVDHTADNARRAAACYRPDLYRAAIAPFGASLPTADARALPADAFFDGQVFDPEALDQYITAQRQRP
jgi:NitT/TauT family transport system ATP-binding protein